MANDASPKVSLDPDRRRDAQRTRQRLIEVAGRNFAEHGYDGTSVRAVATQASGPLAEHLTGTLGCTARDAADRAAAVGALILGVVTSRYIMRSGPLAHADRASLTAWLGDRLQRVLDGPPSPPLVPATDG